MAKGTFNKATILGRLGKDPETNTSQGGVVITKFSVATNHSFKNNQTGEWEDATEWHNVVLFGRLAEVARDYLKKGSQVLIEGRIQTDKWTDKDTGVVKYATKIIGERLEMIGGRGDSENSIGGAGGGSGSGGGAYSRPQPQTQPPPPPQPQPPTATQQNQWQPQQQPNYDNVPF